MDFTEEKIEAIVIDILVYGYNDQEIIKKYNLFDWDIEQLWKLRPSPMTVARPVASYTTSPEQPALEAAALAIQIAAEETGCGLDASKPLSYSIYEKWAKANPRAMSASGIRCRFGTWVEACRFAGVHAGAQHAGGPRPTWTQESIAKLARQFGWWCADNGKPVTYLAYNDFRKVADCPSESLLRKHTQTFRSAAHAEARGYLERVWAKEINRHAEQERVNSEEASS